MGLQGTLLPSNSLAPSAVSKTPGSRTKQKRQRTMSGNGSRQRTEGYRWQVCHNRGHKNSPAYLRCAQSLRPVTSLKMEPDRHVENLKEVTPWP